MVEEVLPWVYRALLLANGVCAARVSLAVRRHRLVAAALLLALALDLVRALAPLPLLPDRLLFALFPTLSAYLTLAVLTPGIRAVAVLPLVEAALQWWSPRLLVVPQVTAALIQVGAGLVAVLGSRTLWVPDRAVLLLAAGDLAALLGPWVSDPARSWSYGVLQSIVVQSVLCYFQVLWLSAATSAGAASPSARWRSPSRS